MYVQPFDGTLGSSPLAAIGDAADNALGAMASPAAATMSAGDAISRFLPPWIGGSMMQNPMQTAFFGPLAGLLQQLMQMLQYMTGNPGMYGGGCPQPYGGEQFFPNANGASRGDPHLSFNGNHWDSMVSQPDLLNSDSIPGGFQISTHVTPPNERGVTWNQSATVSLNNGQTTVSLNNDGQPSIQSFGRSVPIADGQTVQLGNGESVTRNANGSLTVNARAPYGGEISTTLNAQGQGVNVEVSAHDVDLGGALVNGQTPAPISGPIRDPFPIVNPPLPITMPLPPINGAPVTMPHPPMPPILMHPN